MHALFPVSLLFVWRQLEFSVGMADSATNDESYIKTITQIQNLNLLAIALKKMQVINYINMKFDFIKVFRILTLTHSKY